MSVFAVRKTKVANSGNTSFVISRKASKEDVILLRWTCALMHVFSQLELDAHVFETNSENTEPAFRSFHELHTEHNEKAAVFDLLCMRFTSYTHLPPLFLSFDSISIPNMLPSNICSHWRHALRIHFRARIKLEPDCWQQVFPSFSFPSSRVSLIRRCHGMFFSSQNAMTKFFFCFH